MTRQPPGSTRTDTLLPYPRLFRSRWTFHDQRVRIRRVDVRQFNRAIDARADRAALDLDGRDHARVGFLGQRLAAGDAAPQHVRIIQRLPDLVTRSRDPSFAGPPHRHFLPAPHPFRRTPAPVTRTPTPRIARPPL